MSTISVDRIPLAGYCQSRTCLSEGRVCFATHRRCRKEVADARSPDVISRAGRRRTRLLRNKIEERIDEWCKEIGASIASIPIEKIDWQKVIEAAVWHLPPFSPSNVKSEKGFKDALILETASAILAANQMKSVVFVTGDKLLRDAAIKRHEGTDLFTTYERLGDYLSYLKLLSQKAAQKFATKALETAPRVFFDPQWKTAYF
jgi:hypothetical protein